MPLPLLDVWIQVLVVVEDHEQPAPAVIEKLPLAPDPDKVPLDVGLIEYEHAAAACDTVYVFPPTRMELDREAPVFASTEYEIVPFPAPLLVV